MIDLNQEIADQIADAARKGFGQRSEDAIKAIAGLAHAGQIPIGPALLAMKMLHEQDAVHS